MYYYGGVDVRLQFCWGCKRVVLATLPPVIFLIARGIFVRVCVRIFGIKILQWMGGRVMPTRMEALDRIESHQNSQNISRPRPTVPYPDISSLGGCARANRAACNRRLEESPVTPCAQLTSPGPSIWSAANESPAGARGGFAPGFRLRTLPFLGSASVPLPFFGFTPFAAFSSCGRT